MPGKICVFIYNNCTTDARVLKEAKSLVDSGYEVTIIAILDNQTEPFESRDGIHIIRVNRNPIHYRFLRSLNKIFSKYRHFKRKLFRIARRSLRLSFSILVRTIRLPVKAYWWMARQFGISLNTGITETRKSVIAEWRETQSFYYRLIKKKGLFVTGKKFFSDHPLQFLLYGWLILILYYGASWIRQIIYFFGSYIPYKVINAVRKFLMQFHRPLSFYDYYQLCMKVIEEHEFDYFHCHDLHTLPAGYWAKRKKGGLLIYDSHELYTEMSTLSPTERWVYKRMEKRLSPKADYVITVNESIAKELSTRYQIQKPLVIMNCPVTPVSLNGTNQNLLLEKIGIETKEPVILYQGGFAPNRGLENLILAAKYIPKGIMIFMGWGKIEDDLIALANQLQLSKKVFFTGPVSQEELLHYTKAADVGIIPYRFVGLNNYYTSPNKLFEYINANVPIAGSYFPELIRVIDGFQIGATFDPESPEDIAKAINKILSDPVGLNEMKENTKKAAKIYNWENESAKLIDLYNAMNHAHS